MKYTDKSYTSNCLFEAIKLWAQHPIKAKLVKLPKRLNPCGTPHYVVRYGENTYHFVVDNPKFNPSILEMCFFKGHIQVRRNWRF